MIKYKSYSNLLELGQSGVFALVHYRTKAMYIGYSNDILISVSHHLAKARAGQHECKALNKQYKNLRLYVLEYSNDPKIRCSYWYNYYSNLGYHLYNRRSPVKYKLRIEIGSNYLVYVKIVTSRNDSQVIGVFSTLDEATEFYNFVLTQEQLRPILADNELTRKYVEEH